MAVGLAARALGPLGRSHTSQKCARSLVKRGRAHASAPTPQGRERAPAGGCAGPVPPQEPQDWFHQHLDGTADPRNAANSQSRAPLVGACSGTPENPADLPYFRECLITPFLQHRRAHASSPGPPRTLLARTGNGVSCASPGRVGASLRSVSGAAGAAKRGYPRSGAQHSRRPCHGLETGRSTPYSSDLADTRGKATLGSAHAQPHVPQARLQPPPPPAPAAAQVAPAPLQTPDRRDFRGL